MPRRVGVTYASWDACPACKGDGLPAGSLPGSGYAFGPLRIPFPEGGVPLFRCADCAVLYKGRVPRPADLARVLGLAAAEVWRSHGHAYDLERDLVLRAAPQRDRVDLLDVGAGDGDLLAALDGVPGRRAALDATPSPRCRQRARDECISGLLEDDLRWSGAPYHVVTAFDILEHVLHPARAWDNLATLVARGGALVAQTGDATWPARAGVALSSWWYLNLFEHTLAWSPQALSDAARARGFRVESIENTTHKDRRHLPPWKRAAVRGLRAVGRGEASRALLLRALGRDPRTLPDPAARDHLTVVLRRER